MKIYLPIKQSPKTGKGLFLNRLSKALKSLGVEITANIKAKHDISLHFSTIKAKTNSIKVVRYDNIYHNTAVDYRALNKAIRDGSKRADAIIYQSGFGKSMCRKYLSLKKKPSSVIFNGADPSFYDCIEPAKSESKYNFFCFSRWRPHKRLKDIIRSFMLADIPDSCLYIAGDLKNSGIKSKGMKQYFSENNVVYLGNLNQRQIGSYSKLCNAVIHICWFDCCPNSVVESICAGKTVITNNVGGTKEIVQPSGGIICDIDKKYNMEPVDLYHPPKIDRIILAEAMIETTKNSRVINGDHVNINNIAKQYFDFFESL